MNGVFIDSSVFLDFLEGKEKAKTLLELIAATCKHYGITKIATSDSDFKRVDFLAVIELGE